MSDSENDPEYDKGMADADRRYRDSQRRKAEMAAAELKKSEYDPKRDYCGPGQTFWTRWIPCTIFGVSINRCCYDHDVGCDRGGDENDRLKNDLTFYRAIRDALLAGRWFHRKIARWVAQRYYEAVRIWGWKRFNTKETGE